MKEASASRETADPQMVAVQTISTMNMLCAGTLFLAMLLEPAAAFSAGTALYVSQGLLWQRPQSRPSVTSRRLFAVSCCAAEPPESSLGTIAAIGGLVANPVVWVSLVSVKTTGGELNAGPFGLIGQLLASVLSCASSYSCDWQISCWKHVLTSLHSGVTST